MIIVTVLIGSFVFGIFWQLVITRFYKQRFTNCQLIENLSKVREKVHFFVVAYLLIHIGLVGGSEVAEEGLSKLTMPTVLCLGLALVLFTVTMLALNCFKINDRETRITLATHFGSVSVGTFAAAQAFLKSRGIPFASSTSAWLALMEIPSILVGALMLGGGLKSIKDILGDRDIILLIGTLVIGYIMGPALIHRLDFLIVTPFEAVLAYFLFDMGQHAGVYILQLRGDGMKLIPFGILMAIFGGILAGLVGTLAGFTLGNVVILSTLSASASYVAATAVMSKLVSPKAIATSLTVSLGITLPWNILFGIQFYTFIARKLHSIQNNPYLLGLILTWWFIIVVEGLRVWPRLGLNRGDV